MGNLKQSEAFFKLFTQVRKEIADENGYHLATAIKKTFDKWNEWQKGMPEFDGTYLALIEHEQECKNVWKRQEVIDCIFNNWVLKDGQKVVGWKKLSNEDGASCDCCNGKQVWRENGLIILCGECQHSI